MFPCESAIGDFWLWVNNIKFGCIFLAGRGGFMSVGAGFSRCLRLSFMGEWMRIFLGKIKRMANLPEDITTTVFNLHRRLLQLGNDATAVGFTIAQQFGETEEMIVAH